jgi:hypothetical protein
VLGSLPRPPPVGVTLLPPHPSFWPLARWLPGTQGEKVSLSKDQAGRALRTAWSPMQAHRSTRNCQVLICQQLSPGSPNQIPGHQLSWARPPVPRACQVPLESGEEWGLAAPEQEWVGRLLSVHLQNSGEPGPLQLLRARETLLTLFKHRGLRGSSHRPCRLPAPRLPRAPSRNLPIRPGAAPLRSGSGVSPGPAAL